MKYFFFAVVLFFTCTFQRASLPEVNLQELANALRGLVVSLQGAQPVSKQVSKQPPPIVDEEWDDFLVYEKKQHDEWAKKIVEKLSPEQQKKFEQLQQVGQPKEVPPYEAKNSLNWFEQVLYVLINNELIKFGLSPLVWQEELAVAARTHSQVMAQQCTEKGSCVGTTEHQLPGEAYFTDRFVAAGFLPTGFCAENVGSANLVAPIVSQTGKKVGELSNPPLVIAHRLVAGFMKSDKHREAVLYPWYRLSGLGVAVGEDILYGKMAYVTQEFAFGGSPLQKGEIEQQQELLKQQQEAKLQEEQLKQQQQKPKQGKIPQSGSEIPPYDASNPVQWFEGALHALINDERAKHGLKPLAWQEQLALSARTHSNAMAGLCTSGGNCNVALSHQLAGEPDFMGRNKNAGFSFTQKTASFAENVAFSSTAGYGYLKVAQEMVTRWMNSPGHQKNILTADFTKAGMGAAFGKDPQYGEILYATQDFAS